MIVNACYPTMKDGLKERELNVKIINIMLGRLRESKGLT